MLIKFIFPAIFVCVFASCGNPRNELIINNEKAVENISNDVISAVISYSCDSSGSEKTWILSSIQPKEIHYLDSICQSIKITGIRSARYVDLQEGTSTKTSIQVLLTAILGIIGSLCFFIYQKNNKSRHEIQILIDEMEDVKRHFEANQRWITERIGNIQNDGIPLSFYLERFYSWDNLIMNSPETYRTIPRSCIRPLAHARLHVRNTDIEIRIFIEYLKDEKICSASLDEYWLFIKNKHEFLLKWFELSISYLKDAIRWRVLKSKKRSEQRMKMFRKKEDEIRQTQPQNIIREPKTFPNY